MAITENMVYELSVLKLFKLDNLQEGIKVHHDAHPGLVAAAQALYEKKIITQKDGGYLTDLGIRAAEHFYAVHTILTTKP